MDEQLQPLVSIVVPVYNTQAYLRKCVDSLVGQTYSNLDIVLVDDGSTDQSGVLCDELAAKDTRIRVVHKPNGGSSSAREAGIAAIHGEYMMIVDSDDWLDLDTVETCVARLQNGAVDCVMFSYTKEYPENSIPMHVLDGDQTLVGDKAEDKIYRRLFGLLDNELAHPERMENVVSCCMKLYRAEFAKKGRFFDTKEVGSSEDALFNMYALHGAQTIVYIDKPFYHYLKNPTSITNSYRPQLVDQWGRLFAIMQGIINEKQLGERYSQAFNNRVVLSIFGIGANILGAPNMSIFKKTRAIRAYLCSAPYRAAMKTFSFMYLPLVWKVFLGCCKWRIGWAVYMQLCAMRLLKRRVK